MRAHDRGVLLAGDRTVEGLPPLSSARNRAVLESGSTHDEHRNTSISAKDTNEIISSARRELGSIGDLQSIAAASAAAFKPTSQQGLRDRARAAQTSNSMIHLEEQILKYIMTMERTDGTFHVSSRMRQSNSQQENR
jgi:hypothetical protein